jgi:Fe-S cluster biogenesis protein NfuA/nitrite reductase/ring-hydroxylating ferredoxin subunit
VSVETLPGELLDRVQSLSAEIDELPDAHARQLAQELVGAVIAMYGDGLRRIIEAIEQARDAGATILDQLAQDGAVSSLLLIHDLYPVSLQERVIEALDTVRPYMESHGGNVELVGIEDGVAKLALRGSCNGCAASRATLELAIKQALDEHAPDLVGLVVEGVTDPGDPGSRGNQLPVLGNGIGSAFELPVVQSNGSQPPSAGEERPPRWVPLGEAVRTAPGELRAIQADGAKLLLANVDGALLAYRNACASCGAPLQGSELQANMLRCPECEVEFDLRSAGRAAGGESLQLTPVPLLEAGGVRVAL